MERKNYLVEELSNKEKIIFSFYEEKLNIIAISSKLNVSKQYVSKIIKNDIRYVEEKQRRKQVNKIERNKKKVIWNKNKRQKVRQARLDDVVRILHNQASRELSGKYTINNRALKKWNTSIFEYHSKTKEYRVKPEMKSKVSYAIPQKIKWD